MSGRNILYAQSGGVSAVINATAAGVIDAVAADAEAGCVFAARNGILGVLREKLCDLSREDPQQLALLTQTPGGAFGSCRFKLPDPQQDARPYQRLLQVCQAHDIGYFFYNGGNDSQDTTQKIDRWCREQNFPLQCIGLPKTVDNDLAGTDNCPGYGSVAKYVAVSTRECALDVASMCATSTKVFILEVMGRHSGWIAASAALAQTDSCPAPHLLLLPEREFAQEDFLQRVNACVSAYGYCVIVASEGIRDSDGEFLATGGGRSDAFGHAQLGGVAPRLSGLIQEQCGHKCHWATADYLQRSARHIASACDVDQAYQLGRMGWAYAAKGESGIMLGIKRLADAPYSWEIQPVNLDKVANLERKLPDEYIAEDGYGITDKGLAYLKPLVRGESYPQYDDDKGMPLYAELKLEEVPQQLDAYLEG